MESPSDKELELIKQLRENVRDLDLCEDVLSNANLIRWIRARSHNVRAAEEMFRKHITWFEEAKMGSILDVEIPKDVVEGTIMTVCGFDKIGCPILICPSGKIDAVQMIKNGYRRELFVYTVQLVERTLFLCRNVKTEKRKTNCVLPFSGIGDMEGLSWKQVASTDVIQHNMGLAKLYEANYPEMVHKIIIINAPRIFTIIWSIVKQFISAATMEKIQIFGHDREQWQPALYKLASKESLPIKYGGTLPDDIDILPKCDECIPRKRGGY